MGAAYVLLAALAGLCGGGLSVANGLGLLPAGSLGARIEQAHPALMLLYVAIPALVGGFGTLWLPRALARSRMLARGFNGAGLGLVVCAALLTVVNAGQGASAHATGAGVAILLWCAGTLSTCMALLATVFDSRADSIARRAFSPFVWGEMLAAAVLLLSVPVLAGQVVRGWIWPSLTQPVMAESFAGPVSLVILLAGFGIVFEMSARFARFSERPVAIIMAATAATGVVAWVKTEFVQGAERTSAVWVGGVVLALCSLSAVCLAGLWLAGTWKSRVALRTPLLWGLGFLAVVSVGWVAQVVDGTGLHSALQLGALYAVCGGFYLWRGEECGFWYPQALALLHFGLTAAATALVFMPGQQVLSGALFGLSALCFVLTAGASFGRNVPAASVVPAPAPRGANAEEPAR
ncbi:cbb3-type cytochrome c oxidase subunit I [Acetobacter sp. TBRC 12305]|uniref:Cbb3-type cytochrome c oxidase subunit I n=2 Tax=Acetobacter garciniae TaxID=2817435 RepID=A0A939HPZ1_9PROT|nr:cbb3-type cytochrome c oxidase subunit I [Acetobacter garciniae]MBX0345793.1 cbb3-type cytochrome c oxidase subunit I [Acetobacter garciniae]